MMGLGAKNNGEPYDREVNGNSARPMIYCPLSKW